MCVTLTLSLFDCRVTSFARSQPLAHSVARLYTASSAAFDASWQFADVWGAVVLVVERAHDAKPRKLQIWNLDTMQLEFSQELFVGMSYDTSLGYFHTFEIAPETSVAPVAALPTTSSFDDCGGEVRTSCALGLNFANASEATAFGARVRGEIDALESKLAALRIDTDAASISAADGADALTSPSPQGCASHSGLLCFSRSQPTH